MNEKSLILRSIDCIQASEHEADELYCWVTVFDLQGNVIQDKRFPEKEDWILKEGYSLELNLTLYQWPLSNDHVLRVYFKEDDEPSISKKFFEFVTGRTPVSIKKAFNDPLGEFYLRNTPAGKVEWTMGINFIDMNERDEVHKSLRLFNAESFLYELKIDLR
jgi:hypothetical protein